VQFADRSTSELAEDLNEFTDRAPLLLVVSSTRIASRVWTPRR
jgi:hypothetical protein